MRCAAPLPALLVACTLALSNARAQGPVVTAAEPETFGPEAGKFLLNFAGSFTYAENDASKRDILRTDVGIGWFPAREHEFGVDLLVDYSRIATEPAGGSTAYNYRLAPYYSYNQSLAPRTTLFYGPHLELTSFDLGSNSAGHSDFGFGLHAGLRQWLSPKVALEVQPRYTHRSLADVGNEDELQILFGVSIVL